LLWVLDKAPLPQNRKLPIRGQGLADLGLPMVPRSNDETEEAWSALLTPKIINAKRLIHLTVRLLD
jgi:hypothetical protein